MVCFEQVSFMWCLLYSVLAFGQTQAQQPPPTEQQSDDCRSYPSVEERSDIIVRYYNLYGPFAGIFTLNQVVKTRVDAEQPMSFDWHVRYQYFPVPGNRLGRTDVGVDERIFYFRCQGTWTVRGVSEHMTADLR